MRDERRAVPRVQVATLLPELIVPTWVIIALRHLRRRDLIWQSPAGLPDDLVILPRRGACGAAGFHRGARPDFRRRRPSGAVLAYESVTASREWIAMPAYVAFNVPDAPSRLPLHSSRSFNIVFRAARAAFECRCRPRKGVRPPPKLIRRQGSEASRSIDDPCAVSEPPVRSREVREPARAAARRKRPASGECAHVVSS